MLQEEMYREEEILQEQEQTIAPSKTIAQKQRLRFVMLTLVVMGIVGYLMYSGMQDTMGYYLTVSEIIEQGPQLSQKKLRVSGNVGENSMNWSPGDQKLQFVIVDEKTALAVEYDGSVPDTLKQGQKVVVEGMYTDGTFVASELMTTCASKYE